MWEMHMFLERIWLVAISSMFSCNGRTFLDEKKKKMEKKKTNYSEFFAYKAIVIKNVVFFSSSSSSSSSSFSFFFLFFKWERKNKNKVSFYTKDSRIFHLTIYSNRNHHNSHIIHCNWKKKMKTKYDRFSL